MAPLILSRPAPVPAPIASDWQSLSLIWEGWDGSVWDLNSRDGGVLLYRRGVEGMHNPHITRHTSTSRAVPGNRLRGWRAEAREVFWPIYLWGGSSTEWRERNAAFLKTVHPDRAGTWKVTAGSETRSLRLTATFDEPHQYDIDPQLHGWVQYGITLEAEQPFWEGTPIKRGPWRQPSSQSFIDPAGSPPLHISTGAAFGSATVPNPGDVDAYGVWTLSGPLEDIEVGIGDTYVAPFDLIAGETLRIDTDPRNPTAELGPTTLDADGNFDSDAFVGEDATEELGLQDFAPIPPGEEVELHVEAAGAGSIEFELVPLHFRAF